LICKCDKQDTRGNFHWTLLNKNTYLCTGYYLQPHTHRNWSGSSRLKK